MFSDLISTIMVFPTFPVQFSLVALAALWMRQSATQTLRWLFLSSATVAGFIWPVSLCGGFVAALVQGGVGRWSGFGCCRHGRVCTRSSWLRRRSLGTRHGSCQRVPSGCICLQLKNEFNGIFASVVKRSLYDCVTE